MRSLFLLFFSTFYTISHSTDFCVLTVESVKKILIANGVTTEDEWNENVSLYNQGYKQRWRDYIKCSSYYRSKGSSKINNYLHNGIFDPSKRHLLFPPEVLDIADFPKRSSQQIRRDLVSLLHSPNNPDDYYFCLKIQRPAPPALPDYSDEDYIMYDTPDIEMDQTLPELSDTCSLANIFSKIRRPEESFDQNKSFSGQGSQKTWNYVMLQMLITSKMENLPTTGIVKFLQNVVDANKCLGPLRKTENGRVKYAIPSQSYINSLVPGFPAVLQTQRVQFLESSEYVTLALGSGWREIP
ncbi:Oidioi.mRNA.OKI2018_I69.chr2.g8267.t1.cds [Oikopleura dioica]|uniref:Oidioi.mRNA.OKI2018_I69.chr2.g8267.t1.cds n=1 Tax=Oikopleura dioica TaxID=34765 RepID=A0ABN7T8Q6_OIKDI|nr:Oidioi.mRNA.OKI2018_I69.chr2.g8267.t1.cds [Oikopleura dioica]